eukprot:1156475-Pelagomonas_calceolata.AAC.12
MQPYQTYKSKSTAIQPATANIRINAREHAHMTHHWIGELPAASTEQQRALSSSSTRNPGSCLLKMQTTNQLSNRHARHACNYVTWASLSIRPSAP